MNNKIFFISILMLVGQLSFGQLQLPTYSSTPECIGNADGTISLRCIILIPIVHQVRRGSYYYLIPDSLMK